MNMALSKKDQETSQSDYFRASALIFVSGTLLLFLEAVSNTFHSPISEEILLYTLLHIAPLFLGIFLSLAVFVKTNTEEIRESLLSASQVFITIVYLFTLMQFCFGFFLLHNNLDINMLSDKTKSIVGFVYFSSIPLAYYLNRILIFVIKIQKIKIN